MDNRSGDKPPRAKRPTRYIVKDGELLALVTTAKGEVLTFDGPVWAFLVGPLEYSPNVALRTDGRGHDYAKINTLLPKPIGGKQPTHEVARLVLALHMITEADAEGHRAMRSGWSVEFADGDSRNLRLANLRPVEERGPEFHAVWDLERRLERLENGSPITPEWKARKAAGDPGDPARHEGED